MSNARNVFTALIVAFALFLSMGSVSRAAEYVNPETGYQVLVEDDAELLTESERRELAAQMEAITAYGNVAFKTIDTNYSTTESYAREYYKNTFGKSSGIIFLIDMDNRNIWIYCDGAVYRTISRSYANTITDNVYRYASRGDYYGCAGEAFSQAAALLDGQRISQPMKYICNGLLAMILALLINYGIVSAISRLRKPSDEEILNHVHRRFEFTKPKAVHDHTTKRYNPVSSGSGGGSSGGGGGGGGGSSGGGGGHSF